MPPKAAPKRPQQDWSWVQPSYTTADITKEHCRAAAGLAPPTGVKRGCVLDLGGPPANGAAGANGTGETSNGATVNLVSTTAKIARAARAQTVDSDSDASVVFIKDTSCTAKRCVASLQCYNHLGSKKWTDPKAQEKWVEERMTDVPDLRYEGPAGLKNYGATCYANAFLQVWFSNVAFRNGVYAAAGTTPSPLHHLAKIFGLLQHSRSQVVDPGDLIEALQLSKGVQQDAAEFSKLFMSFLADEFKNKSSMPTFISDQFEGVLEYRTKCDSCGYVSSTNSPFLELEISLADKTSLEDRIKHMLLPEKLDGNNKYSCPACDYKLQPATRSTHLKSLPPVLHFSLMRFVYDPYTGNRKKSKVAITYSRQLELEGQRYELRGVVTHVGTSAHSGHFTADVYNEADNEWYLCNDGVVSKLDDPERSKKRLKLDPDVAGDKLSRDAYMLVYKQVGSNPQPDPCPPALRETINAENVALLQEVEDAKTKREDLMADFNMVKASKLDVLRSIQGDDMIVPRDDLAEWVASDMLQIKWDFEPILCAHGQVSPLAINTESLRLISADALAMLKTYGNEIPELDVCRECVAQQFTERREKEDRDEQAAQFDEFNAHIVDVKAGEAYLLPKSWLRTWREGTCREEIESRPAGLFCEEHEKPWYTTAPMRVSPEAMAVLQSCIPELVAYTEDTPMCDKCQTASAASDADRSKWKTATKAEKFLDKQFNFAQVFGTDNYLLPPGFVKEWKAWQDNFKAPRPTLELKLCQHGLLDVDPQLDECDFITEGGWEDLCELYDFKPEDGISAQYSAQPEEGKRQSVSNVSLGTCSDCRTARLSVWETMWLPIVIGKDKQPTAQTTQKRTTKSRTNQVILDVGPTTTVLMLKQLLYEELIVSPHNQQLWLGDRELHDGETLKDIGVLMGDHLNVVEVIAIDDWEMDDDGAGFGGTALTGRIACKTCTYSNDPGTEFCSMCYEPLASV